MLKNATADDKPTLKSKFKTKENFFWFSLYFRISTYDEFNFLTLFC